MYPLNKYDILTVRVGLRCLWGRLVAAVSRLMLSGPCSLVPRWRRRLAIADDGCHFETDDVSEMSELPPTKIAAGHLVDMPVPRRLCGRPAGKYCREYPRILKTRARGLWTYVCAFKGPLEASLEMRPISKHDYGHLHNVSHVTAHRVLSTPCVNIMRKNR